MDYDIISISNKTIIRSKNMLRYDEITEKTMSEVAENVAKDVARIQIPKHIESIQDMRDCEELISELTNSMSYLIGVLVQLKVDVRIAKLNKTENKYDYEVIMAKKEIIADEYDSFDKQKNAISRMITIKQEIDKELQMSSHIV